MDQVRVARFIDLQEAQIATGMLQSQGFLVHLQNENLGAVDFLIRQAIGGFGLWVPEDQADEAKAALAAVRAQPPEPDPEAEAIPAEPPPGRLYGWAIGLLALVSWTVAIIVRRRGLPGTMSLSGFVAASILVLATIVVVLLAADLLSRPHPY